MPFHRRNPSEPDESPPTLFGRGPLILLVTTMFLTVGLAALLTRGAQNQDYWPQMGKTGRAPVEVDTRNGTRLQVTMLRQYTPLPVSPAAVVVCQRDGLRLLVTTVTMTLSVTQATVAVSVPGALLRPLWCTATVHDRETDTDFGVTSFILR